MKHFSILRGLLSFYLLMAACQAELEISPDKGPSRLPAFNFLARQLESTALKIDTTLVEGVLVIDTTLLMDTIQVELYIRQLDFTAEAEKYRLVVTLPADFDGLIHYRDGRYRSGDWIEIAYQELVDYATVLKITQQKPKTGVYLLNMVCMDRDDHQKSAALNIKVP
jgi:hypothetical protein